MLTVFQCITMEGWTAILYWVKQEICSSVLKLLLSSCLSRPLSFSRHFTISLYSDFLRSISSLPICFDLDLSLWRTILCLAAFSTSLYMKHRFFFISPLRFLQIYGNDLSPLFPRTCKLRRHCLSSIANASAIATCFAICVSCFYILLFVVYMYKLNELNKFYSRDTPNSDKKDKEYNLLNLSLYADRELYKQNIYILLVTLINILIFFTFYRWKVKLYILFLFIQIV